jgi:hypothetical protein
MSLLGIINLYISLYFHHITAGPVERYEALGGDLSNPLNPHGEGEGGGEAPTPRMTGWAEGHGDDFVSVSYEGIHKVRRYIHHFSIISLIMILITFLILVHIPYFT